MARQWRIEYEGALYHVMSRGNEGRNITQDNEDRRLFLSVLGEMSDRFDIEVHAWVLMTNHYHLLLRTRRANLSKGMQWLGAMYTRRYNQKYKRRGHLFQGRFKSLLVENDNYLFQLSCYIHRNPLRAQMVKRLADYRWSSYRAYAYGEPGPAWLKTDLILSLIGGTEIHRLYREQVQNYSEEEKNISENIHLGIAAGTKIFAEYIKKKYMPDTPNEEMPQQKRTMEDFDIVELLKSASVILGCDVNAIKKSGRVSRSNKINRDLILYLLWKTGAFTNKEIGSHLGLTYSGVSRRISCAKNQATENIEFIKGYNKIKSLIKM